MRKMNKRVAIGAAAMVGLLGAYSGARAQTVIGNWEDPNNVMDGWFDWQGRGVYSQATYGATNGTHSTKPVARCAQSITVVIENRMFGR